MNHFALTLPLTLLLSIGLMHGMQEKSITVPTQIDAINNPLAQTIYLTNELSSNVQSHQALAAEIQEKNKTMQSHEAAKVVLIAALQEKLEAKKIAKIELDKKIEENQKASENLAHEITNLEAKIEKPATPSRGWFGWFKSGK